MPVSNLGTIFAPNMMRAASQEETLRDHNKCTNLMTIFIKESVSFQMDKIHVPHVLNPPVETTPTLNKTRKKSVLRMPPSPTQDHPVQGNSLVNNTNSINRRKSVQFNQELVLVPSENDLGRKGCMDKGALLESRSMTE